LLAILPNFFRWWNPELKEQRLDPFHAYPRFASRSLATLLRLGVLVRGLASATKPATSSITVIDNPNDPVVDHVRVAQIVTQWVAHGANVTTHGFPMEWNLIHDFMDPCQEEQQIDRVYPLLLQWIDQCLA
jgi:hypothetical protein